MSFVKRNLVVIVMLPVIGGIHYAWMKMNEQEDRKELPIVSMFRILGHKYTGSPSGNNSSSSVTGGPSE